MSKVKYLAPTGTKRCPKCGHFKPMGEFTSGRCADCYREYHRKWAQSKTRREVTDQMFLEALAAYGGKCGVCGSDDTRVLTILPRQKYGIRAMMYNLRANKYPPGYKVICYNCAAIEARDTVEAVLHMQVREIK